jgi:hypothetical protein
VSGTVLAVRKVADVTAGAEDPARCCSANPAASHRTTNCVPRRVRNAA